jgi:isocitrate dehydrogenase kinase/phosphatase
VDDAAATVAAAFDAYQQRFRAITLQAKRRFEHRDWHGARDDATYRLALYGIHVGRAVANARAALGDEARDAAAWAAVKAEDAGRVAERPDCEIAETFFNSVSRRVLGTVGVTPEAEFTRAPGRAPSAAGGPPLYASYSASRVDDTLARRVLSSVALDAPYEDADRDARHVRAALAAAASDLRARAGGGADAVLLDVLTAGFFRNKGLYIVGRLRGGRETAPFILAMLHGERGVLVDAVLTTVDEASVVFGFSWSYFLVEVERPRAMVDFLASIMPHKRVDELYASIGYNRHGKTELYRTIVRHLEDRADHFERAPGVEGLVMSVMTLTTLDVVLKLIKDSFGQPKRTTRQRVMDRYAFVFLRDRVGRLADAQEFEGLEFPRDRFAPELIAKLLADAPSVVRSDGDRLVVGHLYTQRRVTPLNLYLQRADPAAAAAAIVDYGSAIKELAMANIFTGDMLLKNFGVTRHGRVVFYDYDELALLTECNFRRVPASVHADEEMSAEPWYHVGESDVFPEEFRPFLVPPAGPLRDAFLAAHADLLTVEFWQGVQERLRAGEMFDFYPYPASRRLRR